MGSDRCSSAHWNFPTLISTGDDIKTHYYGLVKDRKLTLLSKLFSFPMDTTFSEATAVLFKLYTFLRYEIYDFNPY